MEACCMVFFLNQFMYSYTGAYMVVSFYVCSFLNIIPCVDNISYTVLLFGGGHAGFSQIHLSIEHRPLIF